MLLANEIRLKCKGNLFNVNNMWECTVAQSPEPVARDNVLDTRGVLPYMSYIGMCRCEGYGFSTSLL